MAVTPNGAYVYVTNSGSNFVSIISTSSNTVTSTVPVGSGPVGVAVTPNGEYAYVTNGTRYRLGDKHGFEHSDIDDTCRNFPDGVAVTPNGA